MFIWGQSWQDKQIIFHTDSQSITNIRRSGTCIMRLVRALLLFTVKLNINVLMNHIPGQINVLADALFQLYCRVNYNTADIG